MPVLVISEGTNRARGADSDIAQALHGSNSRDLVDTASQEVRRARRIPSSHSPFPIKLPVRYQAGGESGWGQTVNISSKDVPSLRLIAR